MAFVPELQALAGDSLSLHGDDDPASRFDLQALLDAASPRQHLRLRPQGLIDAVIAGAKARHWPDAHVHFELFATARRRRATSPSRSNCASPAAC